MKRKLLPLLFISSLLVTGCSFFNKNNNNNHEEPAPATITLSQTSLALDPSATFTLTANVEVNDPSVVTNTTVRWKISDTTVASISSTTGKVTVKSDAAGKSAVITAYLKNLTSVEAKCNLTVNTIDATITLNRTTLALNPGESFTLTASVNTTSTVSKTVKWSSSDSTVATVGSTTGKVVVASGAQGGKTAVITAYLSAASNIKAQCNLTVNSINPTAIALSDVNVEIAAGKSRQLNVTYTPSNVNANKDITWTSSNTNVATVSDGTISVKSTASLGQTATITAKLTSNPSISASCTVTVTDGDYFTLLIYMCGSNLESDFANKSGAYYNYGIGLATSDIFEILSVSNKPDDINIVIETGGSQEWTTNSKGHYSNGYDISSSDLQIHHVNSNGKIELDKTLNTYTSMGASSTLKAFLKYGLNNYPAQKTALILWNHGGGLEGVCQDETDYDTLSANEVVSAVSSALNETGNSGEKLEWIGYDACLMAVQDIAVKNSPYFNYMIASEESENGTGWDYDKWVDDLYAYKSTPVVLEEICETFIAENGGNQTLAYYDLSKANDYLNAWEAMAAQIYSNLTTSSIKSEFNTLVNSCKFFGDTDRDRFGLYDAKDFVNKLANGSFSKKPASSYTDAVLTAFSQFVPHSSKGGGAGNAYGIAMPWGTSYSTKTYYKNFGTNFANWLNVYKACYGGNW